MLHVCASGDCWAKCRVPYGHPRKNPVWAQPAPLLGAIMLQAVDVLLPEPSVVQRRALRTVMLADAPSYSFVLT